MRTNPKRVTDTGLCTFGFLLFMGLLVNGFMGAQRINERNIVDERELGKRLAEAACYSQRGKWKYDTCNSQEAD